jgi:hypothetical protein
MTHHQLNYRSTAWFGSVGPTFRGRFVTKCPLMEAVTILLVRYLASVQRICNKSLWGPIGAGIEVDAQSHG